jgi:hypothetical protein
VPRWKDETPRFDGIEILGSVRKLGEPHEDRRKLHHAEEIGGQLFEAHGNATVALEALKEVLHQASLLVEVSVERPGLFSAGTRWDDGDATLRVSLVNDRVGIVALVGNDVGVVDAG